MVKPRYCECCGQLIPPAIPLDQLSPLQRRIWEALQRGQLSPDDLFEAMYRNTRDGGPLSGKQSMYVIIRFLNKKLEKLGAGVRVRSAGLATRSNYRLEAIHGRNEHA